MLPKAKDVDTLRVSADPEKGGIDVARIPPAKYVWDTLPELHGYLNGIIPEADRGVSARRQPAPGTETTLEEIEPVMNADADLTAPPFPDAGGWGLEGIGASDDHVSDPEVLIETDLLQTLLGINFQHGIWYNYEITEWKYFRLFTWCPRRSRI